jgi:hypothetical protein
LIKVGNIDQGNENHQNVRQYNNEEHFNYLATVVLLFTS